MEEERERELESLYDAGVVDNMNKDGNAADGQEVTAVSKQTSETLMAGERIINALDIADKDRADLEEYQKARARLSAKDADRLPPPSRNPILLHGDLSADAYVLQEVERIPSANLLDALLVLPFDKVISLLVYLDAWAKKVRGHESMSLCDVADATKDWNIGLVSRTMFILLKLHHHQIVANRVLRTALIPLRSNLRRALTRHKEAIGYNLAALNHIRRVNDAQRTAQFFEEEMDEAKVRARIAEGRKRKRVSVKG